MNENVVFKIMRKEGEYERIIYNDKRRLGLMIFEEKGEMEENKIMKEIGVEKKGNIMQGEVMEEILKGRRKKMKEELIEKRIIEGIGNIYV